MDKLKKIIRGIFPKSVLKIIESAFRKGRGVFWQARYGFPARGKRVIAVTGTNGKTTTCSYINEVLKTAGYKTAVLTTVFYEIAGKKTANKTHYTISKQSIVQNFFSRAKNADVDFVILEVTSHAIDQDRIIGVPIEIAAITNLTQDHLDYHGTMQEYARVKSILLRNYGAKWSILNADDQWFEFFKSRAIGEIYTVGKSKLQNLQIKDIKIGKNSSNAIFKTEKTQLNISTNLIGEFNLYNAAVAASVGCILEIESQKIEQGIANLAGIDGRMQEIPNTKNLSIYVDFAITPDAIEKTLISLKAITKGKVRIVFGATGDRDRDKRPKMGEIAGKLADFIYLTDDETYTEDSKKIIEEVYQGIKSAEATKKTKVIADRELAIKQAFNDAKAGDSVLVTGLGHEDTRNMRGKQIPWSDQAVIAKFLKS